MGAKVSEKLAFTVEEAARQLSVSRAQIYRLIDTCRLGSITIGRSRRITRRQLEDFVGALEAAASSQPLHIGRDIRPASTFLRPSPHEQQS